MQPDALLRENMTIGLQQVCLNRIQVFACNIEKISKHHFSFLTLDIII